MREVKLCLYFLQPCLSGVKNNTDPGNRPDFIFLRDSTGKHALIFQEYWNRMMVFACKALSKSTKLAYDIKFDPVVRGEIGIHHRFYDARNPNKYKTHEAFQEGTQVCVQAMLPSGVNAEELRKLLETGGRYSGITLHGWGDYGRFEVTSVG